MFSVTVGEVIAIIQDYPELQELLVSIPGNSQPERAYNYPDLYRKINIGETVSLNTSAVKLGLGTGGRHFVIPDQHLAPVDLLPDKGHIMKLRYTPWQFPVLSAEEDASPYHDQLKNPVTLDGVPVVAAPLHSMLPGIILGFRARWLASPSARRIPKVIYIMTDGAALPIALSNLVRELRRKHFLDLTITAGHAFGGDLEAVSIPSALQMAKQIGNADLIVVALGPGIVGTGTVFGFSSIEQSWVIDLTARFRGYPVAVPRISEADPRKRHLGISHHTLTILDLANHPAAMAISDQLPRELKERIIRQLQAQDLLARHFALVTSEPPAGQLFAQAGIEVRSMGRAVNDDPAFFQTTVAAGFLAAESLVGDPRSLARIE